MGARNRFIPALLVALLGSAMLWGTLGYAAYFRSDCYRRKTAAQLARFFQLPVEIGRVEPHTFHSRVFRDVSIWLPDRRDRVFFCPAAIWREAGPSARPDIFLDLAGGTLTIGSESWLPEDYRYILRSALTENLSRVSLRRVLLHGMELVWPKGSGHIVAEGVTGEIAFHDNQHGDATFISRRLNGYEVTEPIHIYARVQPGQQDFLPEVQLTVPRLPIATPELDRLLGSPVRTGHFDGRITYHQREGMEYVQVSGQADGLELRELTQHAPFGPLAGRLSLRIEDARIAALPKTGLESIRFNGRVEELDLGALAAWAGYPGIGGRANLIVYQAFLEGRRLREFSAGGRIDAVRLEQVTRLLGRGEIRGDLAIRLNAVRIVDDQIAALDADIDVGPPRGNAGTIDRQLLLGTFKDLLGLSLPEQLLPERIEFARIGAKVLVNEGRLRLLGTAGENRDAMIVLRLLGQDIPIPAPTETFSIRSVLDRMQARARGVDLETLKRWWRSPGAAGRPASRAASQPDTQPTTKRH